MKQILATALATLGVAFCAALGVTAVTGVVNTPTAQAVTCLKFPGTICGPYRGCSTRTTYFYYGGWYYRYVGRDGRYNVYYAKSFSGLVYKQYNLCH